MNHDHLTHPEARHAGHCAHGAMSTKAAVPGTIYTCPMHPDVRRTEPGACPICGMALEPLLPTAPDAHAHGELADMRRRFWMGLLLTFPVVALGMGAHLVGLEATISNWVQLAFATPVVFWTGWPFFVRGFQSVVSGALNMSR